MRRYQKLLILPLFFVCLITLTQSAWGQRVSASVKYSFDLKGATDAPKMGKLPAIEFPSEAIQNGVEGRLIAEMTLAADRNVKDVRFIESLPFGYEQAIMNAFKLFEFTPARNNGRPIDSVLILEYVVSIVFEASDTRLEKPQVTRKPTPDYPIAEGPDRPVGEVHVEVLLRSDGTVKVLSVASTMPKAFETAAVEAANKIEFIPGVHKKTGKPVTVTMLVVFGFKP